MERRINRVQPDLRIFAKVQRGAQTRAESLFWQQVRADRLGGHTFKRQVPIAPYIVDFLCASARLIVELDGPPHEMEAQRAYGQRRDVFLHTQGFRVLRFSNDEVLGNPQRVMEAVLGTIGVALAPFPALLRRAPSPAEGRGRVEGPAR